jgi:hypothetical protein
LIERNAGSALSGNLIYFLEQRQLRGDLPAPQLPPTDYVKYFSDSGLVRIRRDNLSVTVLGSNPVFLSVHKGSAAMQLRMASAFFGKGQFTGELLFEGTACRLEQKLAGPYYQPLPAGRVRPGEWKAEDRALRRQSEVQNLDSKVQVTERDGRVEADVAITGCAHVPVSVEFCFRPGGTLNGATPVPGIANAYLLESGKGTYSHEGNAVEFGPGQADHRWTQLRGALPKFDGISVYVTGFTPFHRVFSIV